MNTTPSTPRALSAAERAELGTRRAPVAQPTPSADKGPSFLTLAASFLAQGELEAAQSASEFALACDPISSEAWALTASIYAKGKRYERAVAYYVRSLELRPSNVAVWCDVGELLTLLGDYPRAAEALRRAMELDPNGEHPAGRRARAIVGRTLSLLKRS